MDVCSLGRTTPASAAFTTSYSQSSENSGPFVVAPVRASRRHPATYLR
ncbi:MAG: hypothetical protein ACTSU5_21635 [Promethearchaeota archaeon]